MNAEKCVRGERQIGVGMHLLLTCGVPPFRHVFCLMWTADPSCWTKKVECDFILLSVSLPL